MSKIVYLQHVVRVLEGFFGQISFTLDLDVEGFGNVWNYKVDKSTDAENDMLQKNDMLIKTTC